MCYLEEDLLLDDEEQLIIVCRLQLITLVSIVCAFLVYELQYCSVLCLTTERQLLLLLIRISDLQNIYFC